MGEKEKGDEGKEREKGRGTKHERISPSRQFTEDGRMQKATERGNVSRISFQSPKEGINPPFAINPMTYINTSTTEVLACGSDCRYRFAVSDTAKQIWSERSTNTNQYHFFKLNKLCNTIFNNKTTNINNSIRK